MNQQILPHIKQLDGLRGIAILFVLFLHLFNYGFLQQIFYFGWTGVDLFFVLSGFLITGILLDTKHRKDYFRSFWLRRILRIFPLYYAVLIVFAFIAPHFGPTKWFATYQLYFWTYTSNYLILQKGFFTPLGHLWSLAIEEQFYILWPVLVWLLKPKQLISVSILLILAGIIIRYFSENEYIIYGLPFAHADGLMVGGIFAMLIRWRRQPLFNHINTIFLVSLSILIVYVTGYLVYYGIDQKSIFAGLPFTFTLVAVFFGSFLIMSLKHARLEKILSYPLLLFFGKYSYGMYVFNSILFHFSNWAGTDRLPVNQKLLVYLGVFILTIILSYCSYEFFEIRFLRLKKKLEVL